MAIKTGDTIAASDFNLTSFSISLSNLTDGGYSAYCVGPVCVIVIDKRYTGTSVSASAATIGTIPAGYRPAHQTSAMATRNYNTGLLLRVDTDGVIKVQNIYTNDTITGQIVYFRQ